MALCVARVVVGQLRLARGCTRKVLEQRLIYVLHPTWLCAQQMSLPAAGLTAPAVRCTHTDSPARCEVIMQLLRCCCFCCHASAYRMMAVSMMQLCWHAMCREGELWRMPSLVRLIWWCCCREREDGGASTI